jgi:hypothetical protein
MSSSPKLESLKSQYRDQVLKAVGHLHYSYQKSLVLPTKASLLDDEILEVWESFSSRFARVVDLYTTKYLKTCVLLSDPAFDGSYRDLLDASEKLGLIESAHEFMKLREIRNIHAHDYREDKLELYLTDLKKFAPRLLQLKL